MNNLLVNFSPEVQMHLEIILKVLLAVILGGLIGIERESVHRPAGFRTHILVCVGAALVMITSEYIFEVYHGVANIDPARLGAQVISGIGFLGAGTIIRDGATVKGLTTAASLWAVSCIGLAIGIGFYSGAIATAIIIYIVLIFFSRLEVPIIRGDLKNNTVKLEIDKKEGNLWEVERIIQENDIKIRGIRYIYESEDTLVVKFLLTFRAKCQIEDILQDIRAAKGVRKVDK